MHGWHRSAHARHRQGIMSSKVIFSYIISLRLSDLHETLSRTQQKDKNSSWINNQVEII